MRVGLPVFGLVIGGALAIAHFLQGKNDIKVGSAALRLHPLPAVLFRQPGGLRWRSAVFVACASSDDSSALYGC